MLKPDPQVLPRASERCMSRDGVRWRLREDFQPLLDSVLRTAGVLVKESPVKRVTSHRVGARTFFVKRYRHDRVFLRPLKYCLKSSQASLEWNLAVRLDALGIPIVRHLALGERWSAIGLRESILITEGFDGVPLDEAGAYDGDNVLRFVAALHASGVLQGDLHPGNILVSPSSGELRLVDLHGTEIRFQLSTTECRTNIATLAASLALPVSEELQSMAAVIRRAQLAARSRRCLRHNREFGPVQIGGMLWRVRMPRMTQALERAMRDPDAFLSGSTRILKRGRSSTVGCADGLVLKRFNYKKGLNLFKDVFRGSKGRRAFRKAYHLELAGVATARILAMAERRVWGIPVTSFVIMEEIPGAVELSESSLGKAEAIGKTSRLLAMLHDEGFCHRDLKATNILWDASRDIHLIDMEGLNYLGQVPMRQAASDLLRLERSAMALSGFNPKDRWRFLRQYCRHRRIKLPNFTRVGFSH
jgi:tRNA A-37 threonylcarbamoyl transferase component Bud32